MKKLTIGMIALIIAAPFFFSFKNKLSKDLISPPLDATLNGVESGVAKTMITNFENGYTSDKGPKSVSAWYSVDQISAINALLVKYHNDPTVQADGIRIYFGSDKPVAPSTKLTNVKIFLIATKPQATGGDPTKSAHNDYYIPTSGTLTETGIAIDDKDDQVMQQGGGLYNKKQPLDGGCANPGTHFLPSGLAYLWVQARDTHSATMDQSAYNTRSEWFSFCFLNQLFNVITNVKYPFTGLRIYLGKGFKDEKGNIRDVFILVPTTSVGTLDGDSYNCLEDLSDVPFCIDKAKAHFLDINKKYKYPYTTTGAGYDEGELCPDVCK